MQTQEEQKILFQELSARLLYSTKVQYTDSEEPVTVLTDIGGNMNSDTLSVGTGYDLRPINWKSDNRESLPLPVLREVTDIKHHEKEELKKRIAATNVDWKDSFMLVIDNVNGITIDNLVKGQVIPLIVSNAIIQFCYEKHLDCNMLLPRGLAVKATEGTYV